MDPGRLQEWEPVLQSQVAVSLLLLAGFAVVTGALLSWCHTLWRENRELNRTFREHLIAQSEFKSTVENVRELIALQGGGDGGTDP